MREVTYLDSSAIVKRYVREAGSEVVRQCYMRAYAGEVMLAFSAWNLGEVLGAFDKARVDKRLGDDDYRTVKARFLLEVRRMLKLGILTIVPVKLRVLKKCWALVEKYHIYQADAIQVVSATLVNASSFVTGDRRLHEVALAEGLNSTYLG